MAEAHDHHHIEPPKELEIGKNFYLVGFVLTAIGAAAFIGALLLGESFRAWQGYLIGFWFTLGLAVLGPFFVGTQYLTIAGWSSSIRRIPEAFTYYLVPAFILALIFLFGGGMHLYHWTEPGIMDHDAILAAKRGFLNEGGFIGSTIAIFAAWMIFGFWLRRNSVKQDETGDPKLTERNKVVSTLFMVVFAVGWSVMSWYWTMSLEPHWFSTMWQVYTFALAFQTSLALIAVIVIYLKQNGYGGDVINVLQVHALGKLVFAFTVFYAYIAFCQFLLIWYANIPEEDMWYVHRIIDAPGGWAWFIALFAVKFFIPFFALLPQNNKKNHNNVLKYVCVGLLFAGIYEVWYWVAFVPHGGELHIYAPWLELLIVAGFVGIFILSVGKGLSAAKLVPMNDPFLHESVPHDHSGQLPVPSPQTYEDELVDSDEVGRKARS